MNKRYYYDDALAAAWMAREFGLLYLSELGNDLYYDGNFNFSTLPHTGSYGGSIYYVHPDSLYILEPQVGDLIGIFNSWEVSSDENDISDKYSWAEIKESPDKDLSFGAKIIQRNGKAFITPKCEDICA